MKRFTVCTIGAASRDLFLRSADFRVIKNADFRTGAAACVTLGSKIDVDFMVAATGGGATNAAATFASLGHRVAFLGKVGADDEGYAVLRDVQRHGIDTTFIKHDPKVPTAISVLLSTYHHGRTVLVYRGASKHMQRADVPLHRLASRWFYLSSLGGNMALLAWIVSTARRKKSLVMLNPGAGELAHPKRLLRLLRDVAIVLINREEANTLAGTQFLSVPDVLAKLAPKIPGILIITDEARGAWVHANGSVFHSGTHRSLQVVERTGAGDAFGSGFLAGLLSSSGDIPTALQYATANAESVMQHIGAKVGILKTPPRPSQRISVVRKALHRA